MKIIETQSAVLSNHEVLLHVQAVHKRYADRADYADRSGAKLFQLHSVVNDVLTYLTKTVTTPLDTFTRQMYLDLFTQLTPYNLTMGELLALLNHRPQESVNLEPLIEEVDVRFSTEQKDEILQIVAQVLGRAEATDEQQADGGASEE